MSKFKKISVNIRPALLEKLLSAYISGYHPSRSTVAETCSVSRVTSGRAADALLKSGIMSQRIFSADNQKSCKRLFVGERIFYMIIDLSSSVYKMSVADSSGRTVLCFSHKYDTSIGEGENLNIFLSRNGLKVKQSGYPILQTCILYSDNKQPMSVEKMPGRPIMPHITSHNDISDAIFTVLGRIPQIHMTVSEAISKAIEYKVFDMQAFGNGISYIFIGSTVSSFHVYPNRSVTLCHPENILSDMERRSIKNIHLIQNNEADSIFVHIANFMDSAFSPSAIILESDIVNPNHLTADRISRTFSINNRPAPAIYHKDCNMNIPYFGISRSATMSLAEQYIVSSCK